MKYDGKIEVAYGHAAKSKTWKNNSVQWSELVQRLSKPLRTHETYKEYARASKPEKSKIKDVGGYVGAYLRNGRRKPENVVHRQVVTLDLDYAHMYFWDDFGMMYENAAVLHATHSHSEDSPRFRLIMPLLREVSPDEYVAVARKIAGNLNIELFDNTTFETNRLMFWPSVSSDVDYYFKSQDGPWIDPDAVLDSYIDWTDSSLWPTAVKHEEGILSLSGKQEDPETKKGIVGAFCRTYTMTEVLSNLLEDEYVPTNTDDRWTYKNGSTAAGLVVYEDKFAYSHHGTDPCGGKLCNVFDLVRIHKFGHLDPNPVAAQTKSFKAMEAFARNDSEVRGTLALENFTDISGASDFAITEEEAKENLEWAKDLEIDARGKYLSSAVNLNSIFSNDPKLKGLFKFNLFDNKRYLTKSAPWRKIKGIEPIRNVDHSGIRNYIEVVYGISGSLKIDDALALEFERRSFHPIKDYLEATEWDGVERIDRILIDYFGVEDNIYTREAIRKTLVAAVARIYNAGCKYDLVLTLVGEQGCGKSTLVYKLGNGWSSDTFISVQGKEAFEQLQGAWLIEIAELSGMRKAEVEATKHFISKQVDSFRPAYAHTSETYKRQCVFIATTNTNRFLKDPTGDRRFMPIDMDPILSIKSIFSIKQETINQFWAEAKHLFEKGEILDLSAEASKIAKIEQTNHRDTDERTGIIEAFLSLKLPENWEQTPLAGRLMYLENGATGTIERTTVCVAELWCECLEKPRNDLDRYKTRAINDIMRALDGWKIQKSVKYFKNYGKQRYYKKITN